MTATPQILVLYAHPAAHRSRVNRRLAAAARAIPNVTLHDLYETYPDFHIDIPREQALLAQADLVVFQHPIQWYSMPALLKEWLDLVFENGWAYGPGGTALKGKDYWLSVTAGGPVESYRESGYNHRPFDAYLPPFQQTAALCGMRWLSPHIFFGARQADDAAIAAHVAQFQEQLRTYPAWVR